MTHCARQAAVSLLPLILFISGGCANQLLLAPSSGARPVQGGTPLVIPLKKGAVVQVWTGLSPAAAKHSPQAYVLRFCGNGERAEDALVREREVWSEFPVEIWSMNYPGFGGSTGPARLESLPPAALATYDALRVRAERKPIFVSGFSMGSAVGLYVASQRPVAGLVLRNAPPIRQVITGAYGWWNLWMLAGPTAAQVPPQLDSIANARKDTEPAVFVIAGSDDIVPRKYQREVTAAYAGQRRVIVDENAGHNSPLGQKAARKLESELRWLLSKDVATTRPNTRHSSHRPSPG